MKRPVFLVLALLSWVNLMGMCANRGLYVFPSEKLILKNTLIMIEGYAISQDIVTGLEYKYTAYLVCKKQKIKLKVRDVFVGQFRLTQAVLVPETEPTPGKKYRLEIENLPREEFIGRWNKDLRQFEPIFYEVAEGSDTSKPEFISAPREIKKSLVHYGCGPATFVHFECKAKDSSLFWVKTLVKSITTGKETVYCLKAVDGELKIGHGMCSGAFDFKEDEQYEIAFTLMDASGNETPWPGERILFIRPEG